MRTLIESIEDKYDGEDGSDYGFIVFVSSSPECKKGMFPPVMTLCDYDIETVGMYLELILSDMLSTKPFCIVRQNYHV